MNSFDWQWWQYFLCIAEKGSLSAAASSLNVSQPTLSRQLLAMETELGETLFDRSTQGLTLTQFGQGLLEECEHMRRSAEKLQRLADGQDQELSGRVRMTANELIAQYYLPRIVPKFLNAHPKLSLEIVVSNDASSLDKRDADLAIRMFPPTQLDLISRHIFEIPLGFYASQGYLNQFGTPSSPSDLLQHRMLGYDRAKRFEEGAEEVGWKIKNEDFLFRTDFMPLHLETARFDGGIVLTHNALCERYQLKPIDVGIELGSLPIFLCCHRDVQHNKRIRALMDFLAENLEGALNDSVL